MKRLAALLPLAMLAAACGTSPVPAPAGAARAADQAEARWGKVTFSATLRKDTHESPTSKPLPHPYLVVTGTPAFGEDVSATYMQVHAGAGLVGHRYVFPGRDGALYASVANDEKATYHVAWPTGTAYWKVGTWTKPAGALAQGDDVPFVIGEGARLERHKVFAGIRWDTWIALHLPAKPVVVQRPPLIKAEEVR